MSVVSAVLVAVVIALAVAEIVASAWWLHLLIVLAIVGALVPAGMALAREGRR
jgi:hypothetical protein